MLESDIPNVAFDWLIVLPRSQKVPACGLRGLQSLLRFYAFPHFLQLDALSG